MALIKCPQCGKQFSDRVDKCPQCGTSKEEILRLIKEQEERESAECERIRKERERIRKEREEEVRILAAKRAEEARHRAEKRAEWWRKNRKWVIPCIILFILCIFAYVFYANRSTVVAANKVEIKSMFRFREPTHLIIPEGATDINNSAFAGCSYLTSVTIPSSVTSIGNYAFQNCSGLNSIEIPNNVTSIGDGAFAGCTGLTSITIPDGVTSIGEYAFSGCMGLASVTIGLNVTSIGDYTFEDCSSLTTVTWNAAGYTSPSYPAYAPFSDISSQITSFTFGKDVESIPAFLCYSMRNLTSITIPNGVTRIGYEAFLGCPKLKNINIPSSVTSIGKWSYNRISFFVDAENQHYCSIDGVLFDKDKTTLISCPSNKQGKYTIPNSVQRIESHAFANCGGLKSVTIPKSVTSIGESAFEGCSNLTSIVIPTSVQHIGDFAFRDCTGITSITIPNSVTHLDEFALLFGSCKELSVKIPQRFKGNHILCENVTYY